MAQLKLGKIILKILNEKKKTRRVLVESIKKKKEGNLCSPPSFFKASNEGKKICNQKFKKTQNLKLVLLFVFLFSYFFGASDGSTSSSRTQTHKNGSKKAFFLLSISYSCHPFVLQEEKKSFYIIKLGRNSIINQDANCPNCRSL